MSKEEYNFGCQTLRAISYGEVKANSDVAVYRYEYDVRSMVLSS